jgi:hypothetical protein
MDFVLSVAIYLALGIALVAAAIWYGTAVGQRFFASDATPAIAPIEIIGADEPTTKTAVRSYTALLVMFSDKIISRMGGRSLGAVPC